jgi:hypothetical protein
VPAADARRWRGQIGHGVNKGGGEKITVDYFRVGNSTWSHGAGAPMDLGKNRIGLPEVCTLMTC